MENVKKSQNYKLTNILVYYVYHAKLLNFYTTIKPVFRSHLWDKENVTL